MSRPVPPPQPGRRPDLWVLAAFALAAVQAGLRLVPELRPGLSGAYYWHAGLDLVPIAAGGLAVVALAASWAYRPFWRRWRVAGLLTLAAVLASPWAFTTYPSSHDGRPSAASFRLPLDGPLSVASAGAPGGVNRHAANPAQRWAFDLVATRDGRAHRGSGASLDDHYTYGLPVLAPATGVVVETSDDDPDEPPGRPVGGKTPAGNFVVVEVAPSEYLWVCHLSPGSLKVTAGDHVAEGQAIARAGNSGDSLAPHVHLHVQDTHDPDFGEAVPIEFRHYKDGGRPVVRGAPVGGASVEHDPAAEPAPRPKPAPTPSPSPSR